MEMKPRSEWTERQPSHPRRWEVLEWFVDNNGWTQGVEIGLFDGRTTFYLLDHCPNLKMVGVDPMKPVPEKEEFKDFGGKGYINTPFEEYRQKAMDATTKYYDSEKNEYRFFFAEATSKIASKWFDDEFFDFVFIDGCHLYESVKEDLKCWAPKLKKTGWFIGHDSYFAGVEKAINELLPGWKETTNHVWYIPKSETKYA